MHERLAMMSGLTKACAIFVLLTAGIGAFTQSALAVIVDMPEGTILPGCEIDDMCFVPSDVTILPGGKVTWTNSDTAGHTVESGTTTEGSAGLFGTGFTLMPPGESYTFEFDGFEPGTYPYFCLVHPWMEGTVTVSAYGEFGMTGFLVMIGVLVFVAVIVVRKMLK